MHPTSCCGLVSDMQCNTNSSNCTNHTWQQYPCSINNELGQSPSIIAKSSSRSDHLIFEKPDKSIRLFVFYKTSINFRRKREREERRRERRRPRSRERSRERERRRREKEKERERDNESSSCPSRLEFRAPRDVSRRCVRRRFSACLSRAL